MTDTTKQAPSTQNNNAAHEDPKLQAAIEKRKAQDSQVPPRHRTDTIERRRQFEF